MESVSRPPTQVMVPRGHYQTASQNVSPISEEAQTTLPGGGAERSGLENALHAERQSCRVSDLSDRYNSDSTTLPCNDPETGTHGTREFRREKLQPYRLLTDCVVIIAPLVFLAFALAVLFLEAKDYDDDVYAKWRNAITVSATIFPILFASIVGRLVYQAARWKLEQGVSLGTLEQLIGSQTVGTTLLTQTRLRSFNFLGAVLLLLWSLSPLGAQAILRMLGSSYQPRVEPSIVSYFDTAAVSNFYNWFQTEYDDWETIQSRLSLLSSWYSTLLLTPEASKNDTMDLWGNLKIPLLASSDSISRNESWHEFAGEPDFESYSALAGIPINDVAVGNTTFSLESSHISLLCSKSEVEIPDLYYSKMQLQHLEWDDSDWIGQRPSNNVTRANGTSHGFPRNRSEIFTRDQTPASTAWALGLDQFVDSAWLIHGVATPAIFTHEIGIDTGPTQLNFQLAINRTTLYSPYKVQALCAVRQQYVESRVHCSRREISARQNCTVTAQRASQLQHPPESISPLSFPQIFRYVSKEMPLAGGRPSAYGADLSVQYLVDPTFADIKNKALSATGFVLASDAEFSKRLTQLLNTYLLLSQTFFLMSSGSIDPNAKFDPNITVAVDTEKFVQVYTIPKFWVVLCVVACSILLSAGILSVALVHLADGPEIFGYASTVIRDSRHVILPAHAGKMEGIDLSILAKNERVRYGFTETIVEGRSLLGVGREHETESIIHHLR